jgi:hypothetical protein
MKNIFKRIQPYNNERGVALVVVLMVLVVISVLGLSMMALAASNLKMSTGERNYQSAYYIAESGINARINQVSPLITASYAPATDLTDFFNRVDTALNLGVATDYSSFDQSFGQQPKASIKIEKLQNDTLISYSKNYKITSTGTINNRSRTVSKVFHITWKPKSKVTIPASTVIFSNDSYTVKNYKINGSVGSNGTITLQGGQSNISGQAKSNVGTKLDLPEFPLFTAPTSNPDFTSSSLTMDRDKAFNNMSVANNSTLTINVGSSNKNLVINKLTVNSGGKIIINSTGGKLSIYVKSLVMGTGSVINAGGDFQKVFIFLDDGPGTSISGLIIGSMFAKSADITIDTYPSNMSNAVGVAGHLITGGSNVSILSNDNTVAKMIFAPKATVYLNASYRGSIVAKAISSQGNDDKLVFEYIQIDYDNSPLYIDNGSGATPVKDIITAEPVRENS